ncbi:MAG: response regulator transcription factor [Betaproteobacteria bacterium]|nr:response regulator transcription factor [Betaproteobacteria bacterium]
MLELLAKGKANKTIAKDMGLSPNTVKVYTQRLFKALRVTNRTEAVLEFKRLSKYD